jgi:hypothetical protein
LRFALGFCAAGLLLPKAFWDMLYKSMSINANSARADFAIRAKAFQEARRILDTLKPVGMERAGGFDRRRS